jgi:hypothetical protein
MATNGKALDITQMTASEIEDYLRQRKLEQAKIAAEKGKEARKDVEVYLQKKWGLTLAQVWMAGSNIVARTYKNPANGQTYTYSGRGKVPAWLKGPDDKPNPAYEVRSN